MPLLIASKMKGEHNGKGRCPACHGEMATTRQGGAYHPKGNENMTGRAGALPIVEQQQRDEEGTCPSLSRCGNDIVPVREVSFFLKKGKFGRRTLYAQPLNLVPQPPRPPRPSRLRPSNPSSLLRHSRGVMVVA